MRRRRSCASSGSSWARGRRSTSWRSPPGPAPPGPAPPRGRSRPPARPISIPKDRGARRGAKAPPELAAPGRPGSPGYRGREVVESAGAAGVVDGGAVLLDPGYDTRAAAGGAAHSASADEDVAELALLDQSLELDDRHRRVAPVEAAHHRDRLSGQELDRGALLGGADRDQPGGAALVRLQVGDQGRVGAAPEPASPAMPPPLVPAAEKLGAWCHWS